MRRSVWMQSLLDKTDKYVADVAFRFLAVAEVVDHDPSCAETGASSHTTLLTCGQDFV